MTRPGKLAVTMRATTTPNIRAAVFAARGCIAAASVLIALIAPACSSSGDGSTPAPHADSGPASDSFVAGDTLVADVPVDATPPPSHGLTTGTACTDDSVCDVTSDHVNACSNGVFGLGTLDPTPVCVGKTCDPGDGKLIQGCDGATGVCLASGATSGVCLPACGFGADGSPPEGCVGKNACNVLGWGRGTDGTLSGVGYCFGGCLSDSDCTKGNKCQTENGLCVTKLVTYTKTVGTPCTDADVKAPAQCECYYLTSTNKGYCSSFCLVGNPGTLCPSGFVCSAALPLTDDTDGSALFTKDPAGISGSCLKTCTTDDDCTALNSYCRDTASGKICYPR